MNFALPFFNVYMLETLKMNFFYTIILAPVVANIATILFIRVWGKLIDRYGNKPVLAICGIGMVTVPFIWCLVTPQNYLLLVPLANFLTGLFQPGCDVTTANLSIGLSPDKNRSIYIANFTLTAQLVGGGLAAICGGLFMQYTRFKLMNLHCPFLLGQPLLNFHLLFIIAGIIRFIAIYYGIPKITDSQSKGTIRLLKDLRNNLHKNQNSNANL